MPDFAGKSVLVTGANGFIGAHLVKRLMSLGAEVIALVPDAGSLWRWDQLDIPLEPVRLDLNELSKLETFASSCAPDYVFSLAVDRGRDNWAEAVRLNTLGPLALMEKLDRKRLQRFVTIGTSLEVARDTDPVPLTQHGASKAAALQILQAFALANDVAFSPLRTYYVYGPLQAKNKLIPTAMRCALDGEVLAVTDGEVSKRYVHVEDVVSGCLAVLDQPAQPMVVQEIVADDAVSTARLIEMIGEVTGRTITLSAQTYPARSWDRKEWAVPSPGAELLHGWTPQWTLLAGLEDYLQKSGKLNA